MKNGYWKWLSLKLVQAWKWFWLTPVATWNLTKHIGGAMKKDIMGMINDLLTDSFNWENICAGFGSVFIMGLIFGPIFWADEGFKGIMLYWGLAEVSLFLISTYAYWRGKPDE